MAMKVTGTKSVKQTAPQKKSAVRSVDGPSFADRLKETSNKDSTVDAPAEVAPVSGVGAILAAQEVGGSADERANKLAVRYGGDILDHLEEIQRDLLLGAIPKDRLTNLARLLHHKKSEVTDPRLLRLIDEIELRAEVEIAKYTRTL